MKLAVIILTHNEEKNIVDCMQSASFADECLVIDDCSNDGTRELAEAHGARVISHPMTDGFAAQRNFAIEQTTADWIFYLDADERVSDAAAKEIRDLVDNNKVAAYQIKRINIAFGQRMHYGAHKPDWSLRLYPRTAVKWSGLVHEHIETSLPVKKLNGTLDHYTYTDWNKYLEKFNLYTSMMVKKMHAEGQRSSVFKIIFRPIYAFFRAYILKLGFLDGLLGFILSLTHYFYTLMKYVKLYYLPLKH